MVTSQVPARFARISSSGPGFCIFSTAGGGACEEALAAKVLIPLDQKKWPGCYYHHSNTNDVARVEHLTVICTPTKEEAGPTNNWMAPADAYANDMRLLMLNVGSLIAIVIV